MSEQERLKKVRDLLLKLHKMMLDGERSIYERAHGPLNSAEFLNLLLEDESFEWLRKFSRIIVEIDEMFDLKDGIPEGVIHEKLDKARDLVQMKDEDEHFRERYQYAIQEVWGVASVQGELKELLADK